MSKNVTPIPEGYHTVTPSLVIKDGTRAIEFYRKALGARQNSRMDAPDGSMLHAEIQIGSSVIMLNNEHGDHPGHAENCPVAPSEMKGTTSSFYVYVEDVDAAMKRAVEAGAQSIMPVMDMFWGDRMGNIKDPFGYIWTIATRKFVPTAKQLAEGAREFYAEAAPH